MKILIAGLPKTGTTALAQFLYNSLPGKVDMQFEPRAFQPPKGKPDHIVAKVLIHDTAYRVDLDSFARFDRKVFIVRDPRDALVSAHLYRFFDPSLAEHPEKVDRYLQALEEKEKDPRTHTFLDLDILVMALLHGRDYAYDDVSIRDHLKDVYTKAFARSPLAFIREHPAFFPYRYEDMVARRYEPIEAFLGFKIEETVKYSRKVTLSKERVRRTGASGDWKNWFLPEDVDFFRPAFEAPMRDLGYTDAWTLPADPRIHPQFGSDFIKRLIHERRNPPPPTLKTRLLRLLGRK